jgi:hypothetical protein
MLTGRTRVLALGLAVCLSGGCASAPAAREAAKARTDCVNLGEINVITPLDEHHVFLKVGADRFYMFKVEDPCQDLTFARQIVVSDATQRVCGGGTSVIVFENPGVGTMRCRITMIEHVGDKNDALDRIKAEAPPR